MKNVKKYILFAVIAGLFGGAAGSDRKWYQPLVISAATYWFLVFADILKTAGKENKA